MTVVLESYAVPADDTLAIFVKKPERLVVLGANDWGGRELGIGLQLLQGNDSMISSYSDACVQTGRIVAHQLRQ